MSKPIAIYYEQQHWFKPLFAELDRRGTAYLKIDATAHAYAIDEHPENRFSLVVNRMSPSAWNREHGDCIFYTLGFLDHLEQRSFPCSIRWIWLIRRSGLSIVRRKPSLLRRACGGLL